MVLLVSMKRETKEGVNMVTEKDTKGHTNPDAITGAPGSHPGATAIGAASGAATGAAVGMAGGPIGAAIGAIAGGVVGGYMGHGAGEWNDPSDQAYWKSEYRNRPYNSDSSVDFDNDLAPAYQYGSNMGMQGAGLGSAATAGGVAPAKAGSFDSISETARKDWDKIRGKSKLTFDQAKNAMSDAYTRKVQTPSSSASSSNKV